MMSVENSGCSSGKWPHFEQEQFVSGDAHPFSDRVVMRPKSAGAPRNGRTSPSHTSQHNLYFRNSLVQISAEKKARRVIFYRNGDRFFAGLPFAVTPEKHRTFDSLLADLTHSSLIDTVNLPKGVRYIFAMDGTKMSSLDELAEGHSYVCSSTDSFKRINYTKNETPVWKMNKKKQDSTVPRPLDVKVPECGNKDFIYPKLIMVIRNGIRPRKTARFLLNRKTAHSFDQVLSDVTEMVKLDTGAVRKIYTLDRRPVTCLADFFKDSDIFIAYGPEKFSFDDFDLDPEERKSIQNHTKSPATVRKYRTPPKSPNGRQYPSPSTPVNGFGPLNRSPHRLRPKSPFLTKQQNGVNKDLAPCPPLVRDRYCVGKVIGEGNFATVRECVQRSTGEEFALKIINKAKCRGKEHMIESEVFILRRVKHPNIVRLVEEYDFNSELYLVMELVKGGDLFDAIASAAKYTEKDASVMVHDLASALEYLHGLSIVHRDIKPENLLVVNNADRTKSLKLGDFGLAQEVKSPLFIVCGTPTYVAPEILTETGYGLKVDVWAAGVITYILLCGYPPFVSTDDNQEELFEQILSGQYEFNSPYWDDISESAKDVISSMLQVDPDLRATADEVLQHPWVSEDDAHDTDMHLTVAHKLGLHFDTESPTHKSAGITLMTSTALDKMAPVFPM